MTGLHIYRLIPSAPPDDPGWNRTTNHGEVVVRAKSTGDARLVAVLAEAEWREGSGDVETTTTVFASPFRNEKLYTVREDVSGRFESEGPRMVLSGPISKAPTASLQDEGDRGRSA